MEGYTTKQAQEKLQDILDKYRELNKQQPVQHVHLYLGSGWTLETLVSIYAVFLMFDYFLLSSEVENLIISLILLLLPLRYIYYRANRSKLQWENLDEKMNYISQLLSTLKEGEDLKHRSFRGLGSTVVDVFRDSKWIKLPNVILLEGDIVRIRPGKWLPVMAEGISAHYIGQTIPPFHTVEAFPSDNELISKQKIIFKLLSTPATELFTMILKERAQKKKRTSTFFSICLKAGTKFFKIYIICLVIINAAFGLFWSYISDRDWYKVLTNPSFMFLAVIPVILPSLVKSLICWGNAVMWCICEQFGKQETGAIDDHKSEKLSSILKNSFSHQDKKDMFDEENLANKAEKDFDDMEINSLVKLPSYRACLSKFRSFLIGGIQRDFNILDLLSSTSFMCFIDKEGIITENAKYIDEIVLMGSNENKIIHLDLDHKSPLDIISGHYEHDQIEFMEGKWVDYFNSLKSLGLATSITRNPRPGDKKDVLVNLNEENLQIENTGELFYLSKKEEIQIFEDCLCVLARKIGLTEEYMIKHEHLYTLWSTMRPQIDSYHNPSYEYLDNPKKKTINKPQMKTREDDFRRDQQNAEIQHQLNINCNLLSSIIKSEKNSYQMFSQGNPRVILYNCTDYFDGNEIVILDEEDRQSLNRVLMQWTADNYYTIGFSFKPLINEELEEIVGNRDFLGNLDERTKAVFREAQRRQIFLGMIAVANYAKKEANHFIEDMFQAGIRFVIFNEGSYLETKALGNDLGLDTAWNSCINLEQNPSPDTKANLVLPRSIEEIRDFLENKHDLVPLLISMFSRSTKKDILEMIKLYQEHGEIVMVVGGCLHIQNLDIYQAADISIGVSTQPCGYCSTCNGLRLFYGRSPGILEKISERFITLPCIFTLGPQYSLYIILQVVKEARRQMTNIKSGLFFTGLMYISWSFCAVVAICLGLPPLMTPLQCVYIALIVIPTISVSFISTPSPEKMMKSKPIKSGLFELRRHTIFFRNIALRILMFSVIILALHIWQLYHSFDHVFFYEWVGKNEIENKIVDYNLIIFIFGTYLVCIFSACSVNGFESWFKLKNLNNAHWLIVCITNLVATFIVVLVYLGIIDDFKTFGDIISSGWYIYLIFIFSGIIVIALLELLNWEVRIQVNSLQMTLKHIFETKLGLYSPR